MVFTIDDLIEERYSVLATQIRKVKRGVRRERSLRTDAPILPEAPGKFPDREPDYVSATRSADLITFDTDNYDWVLLSQPINLYHSTVLINTHVANEISNGDYVSWRLFKHKDTGLLKWDRLGGGNSWQGDLRAWYIKGGGGNGVLPSGPPARASTLTASGGTWVSTGYKPFQCLWIIIDTKIFSGWPYQTYEIIPYSVFESASTSDIFNEKFRKNSSGELEIKAPSSGYTDAEINIWCVKDYSDGFGKGRRQFPELNRDPDLKVETGAIYGVYIDTGIVPNTSYPWVMLQAHTETSAGVNYYHWSFRRVDEFFRIGGNTDTSRFQLNAKPYWVYFPGNTLRVANTSGSGNTDGLNMSFYYM